jgi:hypothetical protein
VTETPSEAMKRFITTIESINKSTDKNVAEALNEGAATIAPFLTNPQRHTEHIRIILEGVALRLMIMSMTSVMNTIPFFGRRFLSKFFLDFIALGNFKQKYLNKLTRLRTELLASLSPGELDLSIVSPKRKDDADRTANLIIFQINVALYPHQDFVPQALSVRLIALDPEVEFEDVSPSSRVEAAGSYELGVSASGKFTYSHEESGKMGGQLGAPGAKVVSELGGKEAISRETAIGTTTKETGQRFIPLVISSALAQTARWELLAAPQQILVGGTRFFATAFVPSTLRHVSLEAHVVAELDHYGRYELTKQRTVELPLLGPAKP